MANYAYDADGNRYSASNLGTTTSYVVDTSVPYASVVEEYAGASTTPSARYDYGDDLVRMDRGSGVYYYIYDGLGSTRQLVNPAGAITDTWGYSAFGELASHTGGTVNPFLFNAQQFDGASGNYYLRARYYDQSAGRFISQDPFNGKSANPVSLQRYLYASNDPIDRIDPSGREDLVSLSIGSAEAVAVDGFETAAVQGAKVLAKDVAENEVAVVEDQLAAVEANPAGPSFSVGPNGSITLDNIPGLTEFQGEATLVGDTLNVSVDYIEGASGKVGFRSLIKAAQSYGTANGVRTISIRAIAGSEEGQLLISTLPRLLGRLGYSAVVEATANPAVQQIVWNLL